VGALCAALGDADGASRAWHTVIDRDGQFDLVAAAAQALAAVSAWQADLQSARELLNLARTRGSTFAGRYAAVLDTDRLVRADAREQLHELPEDTDALNFLGIAAYIDGQYDQARSYWIDSSDLGDVVSQLLLHLTADGSPPTHA